MQVFYTLHGHTPALAGGARELRKNEQFVTGALYSKTLG